MALTRSVTVGERPVVVRELTVAEVRDWTVDVETGCAVDALRALVLDDCGLDDLARMSDATAASLEDYAPSELAGLVAAARELNPHFFRVRAALGGVARMMLAEAEVLASSVPPASSPPEAMPASGPIPGAPT